MKKYISMAFAVVAVLAMSGCSKENPFEGPDVETGRLMTRNLAVQLNNEEQVVRSSGPDVADFTVDIIREGAAQPEASYKYSEMPEIITLPVGSYKAVAHYGENPVAGWESPYYAGESNSFDIRTDEITNNIDPVVCRLGNVRVTILIDESLRNAMDADARINVRVGDEGSLDFTQDHINAGHSGHFAYVANSNTLAATFIGKVEGYDTHETKTYDNVAPGNHYRITFKLRSSDISDPGQISGSLTVDATVEVEDMNVNVDVDDDILVDDMRPSEGGGDTPEPPTPPVGGGPEITAEKPVDLNIVNDVHEGMNCVLNIHSDSGITKFDVYIESDTLDESVLGSVGLAKHLDMVNPGDMKEGLQSINLPVGDDVLNKKDIRFDISEFMGLLGIYGAANHEFKLVVTDASGTTTSILKLRTL